MKMQGKELLDEYGTRFFFTSEVAFNQCGLQVNSVFINMFWN